METTLRITVIGKVEALELQVPTLWEIAGRVRRAVLERLHEHEEGLRNAASMVASELTENVIKYSSGGAVPNGQLVEVDVRERSIRIRTSNVASPTGIETVLRVVAEIAAHPNPELLYAESIARGLERPGASTQQGLYRIAGVGHFELSARAQGNRLEITAERSWR